MTDAAEPGRIARGCHHDRCDLEPCATCPYAAARHAAAEVDAVDLADRLAEAFPLPGDIVAAGRRLGLLVGRIRHASTADATWAGILRNAENGAATRIGRPLAIADFDALLTPAAPVAGDPWRALALDAMAAMRVVVRGSTTDAAEAVGTLAARRDALLAAERDS